MPSSRPANEQATPEQHSDSLEIERFDLPTENVRDVATAVDVLFTPSMPDAEATVSESGDPLTSPGSSTGGVQGSEPETEINEGSILSDSPNEDFEAPTTPNKDWWKVYEQNTEDADDAATDPGTWATLADVYHAKLPSFRKARLASQKERSWYGTRCPGINRRHERVKAQASRWKRGEACSRRGEEFFSWRVEFGG